MSDVYKENYELRKEVQEMRKAFTKIDLHIFCIGGPLNDNRQEFRDDQLKIFWDIAEIASPFKGN